MLISNIISWCLCVALCYFATKLLKAQMFFSVLLVEMNILNSGTGRLSDSYKIQVLIIYATCTVSGVLFLSSLEHCNFCPMGSKEHRPPFWCISPLIKVVLSLLLDCVHHSRVWCVLFSAATTTVFMTRVKDSLEFQRIPQRRHEVLISTDNNGCRTSQEWISLRWIKHRQSLWRSMVRITLNLLLLLFVSVNGSIDLCFY